MHHVTLSQKFKRFSKVECHGSSPLYEYLAMRISEDEALLELASFSNQHQPEPNLLFGAVHYLLLSGVKHTLSHYYPSLSSQPQSDNQLFPTFKQFCTQYIKEITAIIGERYVQTNEVRRCGFLYPSFNYIYSKSLKPLSLIEIGTSAGLQLNWDRYRYTYNGQGSFGESSSKVTIATQIVGEKEPELYLKSPPVMEKYGLDLHVNDLLKTEDVLWLRSLIWPEHVERVNLFELAAEHFKRSPVKLIEGDGVDLLPELVTKIPSDSTLCIFHTHVANQFSKETKQELLKHVQQIGRNRDVFHLYNNIWDRYLHLDYVIDGHSYSEILAETDGHGEWFKWMR